MAISNILRILLILLVAILVGCDSREKKCARWDATVKGYEYCAADFGCRMTNDKYEKLTEARIEQATWCRVH